jgi:hypothetical protein
VLKPKRVECDEIGSFNHCKRLNVANASAARSDADGLWTWTGLDRDRKLIISYLVGGRHAGYAAEFVQGIVTVPKSPFGNPGTKPAGCRF